MARVQYFVVLYRNQWQINFQGHHFPYRTQKDPIRAAVDAAHVSGRSGHDAQVLVQGRSNQFRAEWTYGHDPYPPAG